MTTVINLIDLSQYGLTIYVVVSSMIDQAQYQTRIICIYIILTQAAKVVLDWLRLFENTSFFVSLIISTFIDI